MGLSAGGIQRWRSDALGVSDSEAAGLLHASQAHRGKRKHTERTGMPVPDIRHKEECGVLKAGAATRSCANNAAEKVTYLGPWPRSQALSLQEAFSIAQGWDKQS